MESALLTYMERTTAIAEAIELVVEFGHDTWYVNGYGEVCSSSSDILMDYIDFDLSDPVQRMLSETTWKFWDADAYMEWNGQSVKGRDARNIEPETQPYISEATIAEMIAEMIERMGK